MILKKIYFLVMTLGGSNETVHDETKNKKCK